jgi:hypothetical protein
MSAESSVGEPVMSVVVFSDNISRRLPLPRMLDFRFPIFRFPVSDFQC